MTEFQQKVYNEVSNIKRGSTMTYTEVARAIGNPRAVRAVGNALNKNTNPDVPCHRVIRSDGKIGGYNRGSEKKMEILMKEGGIGEY
ncbi:MAG: MGMT family protein [Candidatus Paceibacterota bacterium]